MTRIPPLLPEETLTRVLRVARFDGMGVLTFAGFFAILSALAGDRLGAMIGLLIAAAGAIELHGATLLVHGERRGMPWLIVSQVYLMMAVLGYCEYRLLNVDLTVLRAAVTDDLKTMLAEQGWGVDQFLRAFNRVLFGLVALLTVAYQGGMIVYYARRRRTVTQALHLERSS